MLTFLETLGKRIDRVLHIALVAMSSFMLLVNLAQISGRYLFSRSIGWSEELSTYMYVWIIFLSLHMITREKAELAIDVIKTDSRRKMAVVNILRDAGSLAAMGVMLLASVMMIRNSILFPRQTASLGIATYPLYMCLPIGIGLALLQKGVNLAVHIRDLAQAGPSAPKDGPPPAAR